MAEGNTSTMAQKRRLVGIGGRLAQEFGFSRVAGEALACLYLTDGEVSLDALERELGLSKAAVSLATTQLERLGLAQRVRKAGDRRRYYRSADDIGSALRQGIMTFAREKMALLATKLQQADEELKSVKQDADARFLTARVARMRDLNRRAARLLDSPLVKMFAKLG
ncbi:MAG: MarR family transcriptional regulator [Kiritimatiellae bacterium]|nr:MarR family transcriptional regulator [Kiritimatiellia bacterium]